MVEKALRQIIVGCFYGAVAIAIGGTLVIAGSLAVLVIVGLCWYGAFEAESIVANVAGFLGIAFCACCLAYAVLWLRRQGIKAKVKGYGTGIYHWVRGKD